MRVARRGARLRVAEQSPNHLKAQTICRSDASKAVPVIPHSELPA
jgi:hypothetical protein